MNPSNPIGPKVHSNTALVCDAPRCAHLRVGASAYCANHKWARRQHGHPLGRHIYPREYAQERRDIAKLFREQREHPALLSALAFVSAWLAFARAGGKVPAARQVARLAASGTRAHHVLEEIASVWTFAQRNRRALPDDARLEFAIATAVFSCAPRQALRTYTCDNGKVRRRYPNVTRDEKREAGEYIRRNLSLFLQYVALLANNAADTGVEALRQGFAPFPSPHHSNHT